MARKPRISTRLSAASLVRLGAPRLAELLVEATAGNANLKRRLRLELAAEMGPETLALEIDKRITAISTARTRVSWRKRGELIDDRNTHRRMILERLAPVAPGEALAVLVRWFDLYPALAVRVKDPKGELPAAFEAAAPELFTLPEVVGEAALRELVDALRRRPQDYARWISAAGETLGPHTARQLLSSLDAETRKTPAGRNLLRRLADRADDLDLWLSLVAPEQAGSPDVAADVARASPRPASPWKAPWRLHRSTAPGPTAATRPTARRD